MPAKLRAVPPAMTLAEKIAAANYHAAEAKRLQAEATAEARAILRGDAQEQLKEAGRG